MTTKREWIGLLLGGGVGIAVISGMPVPPPWWGSLLIGFAFSAAGLYWAEALK